MASDTESLIHRTMSRRSFLAGLGAAGALMLMPLSGCGYYGAEQGDAYQPWEFPAGESRPEYLAVGAAILAASPHNTQPWRFAIRADAIDVWVDPTRNLGPLDALRREMYIGVGCAIENLVIAANANGRAVRLRWFPTDDANLVVRAELEAASPTQRALYGAIARRHTHRGEYANTAAPAGLRAALAALIDESDVRLTLVEANSQAGRAFREGTIAATHAIVDDRAMNEASHQWWRQSDADIAEHRDGLTLDATGLGASRRALGKIAGATDAEAAGEYWIDMTQGVQTTGSAFGVLSTPRIDSRDEQLRCGRIWQRLHLWATDQSLAMQPLNQMAERRDREIEAELEPRFGEMLGQWTPDAQRAQMLFRVGYAWDSPLSSPRRPLDWVTS